MLPGLDGLSLVEALRAAGVRTPVLFLTAMGGVDDRVSGLRRRRRRLSREALCLRRASGARSMRWFAGLRGGARDGRCASPTSRSTCGARRDARRRRDRPAAPEFRLLEYLMRHAGEVVTRTMLLENVWDFHFDPRTNVVEAHISRLRAKIDRPSRPSSSAPCAASATRSVTRDRLLADRHVPASAPRLRRAVHALSVALVAALAYAGMSSRALEFQVRGAVRRRAGGAAAAVPTPGGEGVPSARRWPTSSRAAGFEPVRLRLPRPAAPVSSPATNRHPRGRRAGLAALRAAPGAWPRDEREPPGPSLGRAGPG